MEAEQQQEQSSINLDPSLEWDTYYDYATKVPSQVLYEEITADSVNQSGYTFNFRSPADNALMDNDLIIEYELKISKTNWGIFMQRLGGATRLNRNAADNAELANDAAISNEMSIAFRQCFPMARAIQNLSVTINGSNFNVQPVYWIDALNRLYFSEEDAANFCSTSGGEFDGKHPGPEPFYILAQNSMVPTADVATSALYYNPGGVAMNNNTASSGIPLNCDDYYNKGLEARWQKMISRIYEAGSTKGTKTYLQTNNTTNTNAGIVAAVDGVLNNNDEFSLKVYERLPIAPFLFHPSKDQKMSIPNIKQINISAQFVTGDLYKHVLQGNGDGQLGANGARVDPTVSPALTVSNCKLHCKWRLSDIAIPPVVRIPAPKYLQYIQSESIAPSSAPTVAGPTAISSRTFSNIQLDAIPDKFFIFIRRRESDYEMTYPSEFCLSIKEITLTIGGSSGRLTSFNAAQMYSNFLRYSAHGGEKKLDFDTWYKYRCVYCLDASDIGLVAGAGYNYKTSMTVKVSPESYWFIPGIYNRRDMPYLSDNNTARDFDFVVLCQYNHHWIELNSSGGSKSGMTMIPRL